MKQTFLIVESKDGLPGTLSENQYKRLHNQLNRLWKKNHPNSPKPILLEGGIRVQVEEV